VSHHQKDIRALTITAIEPHLSGTGEGSVSICLSNNLNGTVKEGLVVDAEQGLWAINRGAIEDLPARGEVYEVGKCSSRAAPGEYFAVINLDNDEHVENVAKFVAMATANRLKLWRLPSR
jgi:hypothetical protein